MTTIRLITALFVFLLTLYPTASYCQQQIRIALVHDGPSDRARLHELVKEEISALTRNEFSIVFPEKFDVYGDWTTFGVRRTIDRVLRAPDVDLVITLGMLGTTDICRRGALAKPVIAAHAVDPALFGIPEKDGRSGVRNLVYLTTSNPVYHDLAAFRQLIDFKHLAVLGSAGVMESVPDLANNVRAMEEQHGISIHVVPVGPSVTDTIDRLPEKTDAIYLVPLRHLSVESFTALINECTKRNLPSFSAMGVEDVQLGVLGTLGPENAEPRLARRIALYAQRILQGEPPESLSAAFPARKELTLNMETARAIGFYPTWSILSEARLINEEPVVVDRSFTLRSAVEAALDANLELQVKDLEVAAGAENIAKAKARLKPELDASTVGVVIDKDLANPLQPERLWTGSIQLKQVLYSDLAWANVSIQKRLQKALEQEQAGLKLDITQLAAEAYFNVLRAKTFERIQRDNVKLTRQNLELAQVRQASGIGGAGEVYRWEAELAQARVEATNAREMRHVAELQMSRVLHLPQEDTFDTMEVGIEDKLLITSEEVVLNYLNNPGMFVSFRDYLVLTGLKEAPELFRLDAAIAARDRQYLASKRAYYLPTIGLEAEGKRVFEKGGAGTAGGLASLLMPGVQKESWTLGVQASIPIYSGGARKAERMQAKLSLAELKMKRLAVAEKLEQRIRTAAHKARGSFSNIAQAEQAADAAGKGLHLVSTAYAEGVSTAIDLLDAQNEKLVADLRAGGARYEFLLDLMELYRAVGVFGFMETEAYRQAWLDAASTYMTEQGIAIDQ